MCEFIVSNIISRSFHSAWLAISFADLVIVLIFLCYLILFTVSLAMVTVPSGCRFVIFWLMSYVVYYIMHSFYVYFLLSEVHQKSSFLCPPFFPSMNLDDHRFGAGLKKDSWH